VNLTDSLGCVYDEKYEIKVPNCDTIEYNKMVNILDTTINYATKITLDASSSYNGYKWNPTAGLSCSNCQNPNLEANKTISYEVSIADKWLCPYTEVFNITLVENGIIIPNVITPNGDGYNDNFVIKGLQPPTSIKIIDNKGTEVYFSDNYQNDWDGRDNNGKALNEGTYWYIITNPTAGVFKGWVYIKR
jgi:gliding motility-associated-like protein